MAISKLILNGDVQMDVTSDTVSASRMLNGYTATKNDGTKVTGNIATKTASDLTASGSTVTVPGGYYAAQVTKNVASTTHPNPTAAITSSTGVVTATHTQTAGYVAAGTTTGTTNLTTQAAQTINTSTADQTIASYRWLTGTQTIKSVTTSNLTAANIASGVVVKIGDANNASRITQVTGTYAPAVSSVTATPTETAQTFNATGVYGYKPVTVNAISSTYVGTGVDRRDGENTTFTQSTGTFYGPSGYYAEAFTRIITTQAAQTINTSTADQTIASNRWLTGTQTIKSVTTSNLTAANIAEGVTVKVGDANNASRITQVTGTHSGATSYTATISGTGNGSYCYVTYDDIRRYGDGATFTFKAGDTLTIYCRGNNVTINGDAVTLSSYSYTYTLPIGDITINLTYSSSTSNNIKVWGLVQPTGTYSVSAAGNHNVYKYSVASVPTGSAFPPSTTITTNPSFTLVSSTAKITAAYNGTSYVTPTVTSGWVAAGTSGVISTTGTSTYTMTSQAAQTLYPSTADQTVASYRWLTGTQTFKSVTTTNLTAANIVSGTVVKVGDSGNASRITQVTGTFSGIIPTGTSTITSNGTYNVYGYASASVSVADPEYYSIYKSMTYCSALYNTNSEVRNWCNSLSIIPSYMFTGRTFDTPYSSSYTFQNVTSVDVGAFAEPYYGGTTTFTIDSHHFYFPKLTNMGSHAFERRFYITAIDLPILSIIPFYAFSNAPLFSISAPLCTVISNSAFYNCGLTTANFPSCTTIGSYAFTICSKLTTASFSVCTTINSCAFSSCSSLTTISFPVCSIISTSAFARCSSLTTISFPVCSIISTYAFISCSKLTTASFSACTATGNSAFAYCPSLSIISFPACTTIGAYTFYYCPSLVEVSFPSCTTIESGAFGNCYSLTVARFPICNNLINSWAFSNCYNLISLYLTNISSVPTLTSTNVFNSTPLYNYSTSAGQWGKIYVPSSLYTAFQTAAVWSTASIKARLVSV